MLQHLEVDFECMWQPMGTSLKSHGRFITIYLDHAEVAVQQAPVLGVLDACSAEQI